MRQPHWVRTVESILILALLTCLNGRAQELSDEERLIYAESLIIVEQYQKVTDQALVSIQTPSLRYYYLQGISYKYQEKWDEAIKHFRRAVTFDRENNRSMVELSFLGLGQALMQVGEHQAAIDTFRMVTQRYHGHLSPDYPRYPVFLDDGEKSIHSVADDAQFAIAECYERLNDGEKARDAFAKVTRFYPFSSLGEESERRVNNLLK